MNQFSKRNSHIFSFQDWHIFLRWILTSLTSGVGDEGPVLRKRGMAGLRASPGSSPAGSSPAAPSPAAHRPGARGVTSNSRIKGVALVTFALPPGSASGLLPLSRVSPSLHLPLAPAPSSAPSAEPTDRESPALLSPPPRGCLSRLNAPQDAMALYLLTDLV